MKSPAAGKEARLGKPQAELLVESRVTCSIQMCGKELHSAIDGYLRLR
jgi:hypothetical protein